MIIAWPKVIKIEYKRERTKNKTNRKSKIKTKPKTLANGDRLLYTIKRRNNNEFDTKEILVGFFEQDKEDTLQTHNQRKTLSTLTRDSVLGIELAQ